MSAIMAGRTLRWGNRIWKSIRPVGPGQDLNGMDGPPAESLVELDGGQRAIGSRDFRLRRLHLVEGFLAGQHGKREKLLLHGPRAIVRGALVDQRHRSPGDQAHHVPRAIADVLRLQMAGQVVADFAGRGAKVAVKRAGLLELKQILAEVHGSRGHLARRFGPVQLGVFLAQHIRARRIDGQDLLAGFDVRQ
ncbi:MAG: hypothetical protein LAN59_09500 [Acidobacteriia bacterium]|nr:hypothetical protein [Terriglobia bacterium]